MTEALIQSIQAALVDGASDEARAAGADACRTILAALEAKRGAPIAVAPATSASPIATAVRALRGMPSDQLLDFLIAKLRTMVPADTAPASPFRLAIPTIPVR